MNVDVLSRVAGKRQQKLFDWHFIDDNGVGLLLGRWLWRRNISRGSDRGGNGIVRRSRFCRRGDVTFARRDVRFDLGASGHGDQQCDGDEQTRPRDREWGGGIQTVTGMHSCLLL